VARQQVEDLPGGRITARGPDVAVTGQLRLPAGAELLYGSHELRLGLPSAGDGIGEPGDPDAGLVEPVLGEAGSVPADVGCKVNADRRWREQVEPAR
jgi:hypothetical protein